MKEKYYLCAFWRQRRVGSAECAKRINQLLSKLRGIDNQFATLHKVGTSLSRPIGAPIGETVDEIVAQLYHDRQFPECGYMFSAVLPDESIGVDIEEGVWSQHINPANALFIEFQVALDQNLFDFLTTERLSRIVCAVAEIFDPAWAGVVTSHHLDKVGMMGGVPFASWLLYLRQPLHRIPSLPTGVGVHPVGTVGVLIVTVQELFLVDNEHHIRLAAEVTKRLSDAQVLDELDCTRRNSSS